MTPCDILAIGPHPDDAELGVGGILAKAARAGYRTGIIDLTAGELSTRGDVETRAQEAGEAARILGITHRENVCLPDGGIANDPDQQLALIIKLRTLRPRILLAPMRPDRHPDHESAAELVKAAHFFAGLAKVDTGQQPHRAERVYYYTPYFHAPAPPSVVIDISDVFEVKMQALAAYHSQFHNPDATGPETFISSESFWQDIRTRAAYWGSQIGVAHGEPLHHGGPLGFALPPGLGAE
jgi:bacillithiol biosynthesis deacetylase BshB1